MRIVFIPPTAAEFSRLFSDDGQLSGGGMQDIRIYTPPSRSPRGAGIVSLLAGLGKKIVPFLMRTILPEGLSMAHNVISDINSSISSRQSLKRRGLQSVSNVGRRVLRGGGGKTKRIRMRQKKKKTKKKKKCVLKKRKIKDVFSLV